MIYLAILAVGAACESGSGPIDPLDRELIQELAIAQGAAGGNARSGFYSIQLEPDECDCPSIELDDQTIDPCVAANFNAELSEANGVLALSAVSVLGLMTGAIEADGSFVIAGIHDLSTAAGTLEALRRMDGQFATDDDAAEGWVGQRLIGEIPGQTIDCRWTGTFVASRE
jgi:hypothetical protein